MMTDLARKGPFTASAGEAWVELDLASMALSALANAMRVLASAGRFEIVRENGRRVLARRVPRGERT